MAELLQGIPGRRPLELRDAAMAELACAAGLRAEELVSIDALAIDPAAQGVRVEGRGEVPVGERAWHALDAYLRRGRPVLATSAAQPEPALFLSKTGRRLSTSDVRRRLRIERVSGRTSPTYTRVESGALKRAYARAHPRA